jgi:DNA-binding SARP family transcriptional activator
MAMLGIAAASGPTASRPYLRLLRSFGLVCADRDVSLPLSAQRILVFVALRPEALKRQHVACSLWLDYPEQRAHANLRSALWRIHRTGLRLVNADATTVQLDSAVVVDLREAEALAQQVLDPLVVVDNLDVGRLDGDLLPDWYDDWLVFDRERHRQLRLHALEALCERLTQAGRLDAAVQAGLAAVASEPLRETAHQAVIRAHLAEGNASEALRQFKLCQRLLRKHLGVEPSERTSGLLRDIQPAVTFR